MDDSETRSCRVCGKDKLLKSFPKINKGPYRERRCYSCRREANKQAGRCSVCYKPAIEGKTYCDEHLKSQRDAAKQRTKQLRIEAIEHYCNGSIKCQCPKCDVTDIRFLTIDHINGDGNTHRRDLSKSKKSNPGSSRIYSWLKQHNYPDGFQILCFNCNCAKGIFGICPHED